MATDIRSLTPGEELDYPYLMHLLSDYRQPRLKVHALLRSGDLIRVKKGLYAFGPRLARGPLSREILANLIYGPSCLSLEYALALHGLIPERVEAVTSVTSGRMKRFDTPVGTFLYEPLPPRCYPHGIVSRTAGEGRSYLIASPEKALCDLVLRRFDGKGAAELTDFLFDDRRIDPAAFRRLDPAHTEELAAYYGGATIHLAPLMRGRG
ncbi:MAG TPA: hypothetical protein PLV42_07360 [bacterium]|nr:hypothetical protein [bacterium]